MANRQSPTGLDQEAFTALQGSKAGPHGSEHTSNDNIQCHMRGDVVRGGATSQTHNFYQIESQPDQTRHLLSLESGDHNLQFKKPPDNREDVEMADQGVAADVDRTRDIMYEEQVNQALDDVFQAHEITAQALKNVEKEKSHEQRLDALLQEPLTETHTVKENWKLFKKELSEHKLSDPIQAAVKVISVTKQLFILTERRLNRWNVALRVNKTPTGAPAFIDPERLQPETEDVLGELQPVEAEKRIPYDILTYTEMDEPGLLMGVHQQEVTGAKEKEKEDFMNSNSQRLSKKQLLALLEDYHQLARNYHCLTILDVIKRYHSDPQELGARDDWDTLTYTAFSQDDKRVLAVDMEGNLEGYRKLFHGLRINVGLIQQTTGLHGACNARSIVWLTDITPTQDAKKYPTYIVIRSKSFLGQTDYKLVREPEVALKIIQESRNLKLKTPEEKEQAMEGKTKRQQLQELFKALPAGEKFDQVIELTLGKYFTHKQAVQDITDDRWAVLQINNHPISVKYKVNGDITEVFTEELKSDFNSNVWFQQKFGKLEKFHEEVRSQLVQKIDKQEQLKIRLLTIRDITVVGQMITRSQHTNLADMAATLLDKGNREAWAKAITNMEALKWHLKENGMSTDNIQELINAAEYVTMFARSVYAEKAKQLLGDWLRRDPDLLKPFNLLTKAAKTGLMRFQDIAVVLPRQVYLHEEVKTLRENASYLPLIANLEYASVYLGNTDRGHRRVIELSHLMAYVKNARLATVDVNQLGTIIERLIKLKPTKDEAAEINRLISPYTSGEERTGKRVKETVKALQHYVDPKYAMDSWNKFCSTLQRLNVLMLEHIHRTMARDPHNKGLKKILRLSDLVHRKVVVEGQLLDADYFEAYHVQGQFTCSICRTRHQDLKELKVHCDSQKHKMKIAKNLSERESARQMDERIMQECVHYHRHLKERKLCVSCKKVIDEGSKHQCQLATFAKMEQMAAAASKLLQTTGKQEIIRESTQIAYAELAKITDRKGPYNIRKEKVVEVNSQAEKRQQGTKKQPGTVTLITWNANGIMKNANKKWEQLQNLQKEHGAQVIAIQETKHTHEEVNKVFLKAEKDHWKSIVTAGNYARDNTEQEGQQTHRNGGVATIARHMTSQHQAHLELGAHKNNLLHTRYQHQGTEYDIINCYVPVGNGSKSEKNGLRCDIQDKIVDLVVELLHLEQRNILILGDFNRSDRVETALKKLGLHELVGGPTHREGGCLDQVWTNCQKITCNVTEACTNDHHQVVVTVRPAYPKNKQMALAVRKQPLASATIKSNLQGRLQLKTVFDAYLKADKTKPLPTVREILDDSTFTRSINIAQAIGDGAIPFECMHNPDMYYVHSVIKEATEKYHDVNESWNAGTRDKECYDIIMRASQIRTSQTMVKGIIDEQGKLLVGETAARYYADKFDKGQPPESRAQETREPLPEHLENWNPEYILSLAHHLNPKKALGPGATHISGYLQRPKMQTLGGKEKVVCTDMMQIQNAIATFQAEEIAHILYDQKPIPQSYKQAKLVMLSKTGEPNCKLEDIRPIAVQDDPTKLLEISIRMYLKELAERSAQVPLLQVSEEYQTGFKPYESTATNQVRVIRHMRNPHWHIAFYDFKNAFGSINRQQLFQWLREDVHRRQIKGELRAVQIMEELFDSTEIVSEGVTFSVTKGTPQGGKLSPDLFNYYLHKCILESPPLMKLMRERKLLAYADDIAVLATTEKEIQNATDEIKKLGKYGLCINFRKSQVLSDFETMKAVGLLVPQGNSKHEYVYKEGSKFGGLDRCVEYKYLGIKVYPSVEKSMAMLTNTLFKMAEYARQKLSHSRFNEEIRTMIAHMLLYCQAVYHLTPYYATNQITYDQVMMLEQELRAKAGMIPKGVNHSTWHQVYQQYHKPLTETIMNRINRTGLRDEGTVQLNMLKMTLARAEQTVLEKREYVKYVQRDENTTPPDKQLPYALTTRIALHRDRRACNWPYALYCQKHAEFLTRDHYEKCDVLWNESVQDQMNKRDVKQPPDHIHTLEELQGFLDDYTGTRAFNMKHHGWAIRGLAQAEINKCNAILDGQLLECRYANSSKQYRKQVGDAARTEYLALTHQYQRLNRQQRLSKLSFELAQWKQLSIAGLPKEAEKVIAPEHREFVKDVMLQKQKQICAYLYSLTNVEVEEPDVADQFLAIRLHEEIANPYATAKERQALELQIKARQKLLAHNLDELDKLREEELKRRPTKETDYAQDKLFYSEMLNQQIKKLHIVANKIKELESIQYLNGLVSIEAKRLYETGETEKENAEKEAIDKVITNATNDENRPFIASLLNTSFSLKKMIELAAGHMTDPPVLQLFTEFDKTFDPKKRADIFDRLKSHIQKEYAKKPSQSTSAPLDPVSLPVSTQKENDELCIQQCDKALAELKQAGLIKEPKWEAVVKALWQHIDENLPPTDGATVTKFKSLKFAKMTAAISCVTKMKPTAIAERLAATKDKLPLQVIETSTNRMWQQATKDVLANKRILVIRCEKGKIGYRQFGRYNAEHEVYFLEHEDKIEHLKESAKTIAHGLTNIGNWDFTEPERLHRELKEHIRLNPTDGGDLFTATFSIDGQQYFYSEGMDVQQTTAQYQKQHLLADINHQQDHYDKLLKKLTCLAEIAEKERSKNGPKFTLVKSRKQKQQQPKHNTQQPTNKQVKVTIEDEVIEIDPVDTEEADQTRKQVIATRTEHLQTSPSNSAILNQYKKKIERTKKASIQQEPTVVTKRSMQAHTKQVNHTTAEKRAEKFGKMTAIQIDEATTAQEKEETKTESKPKKSATITPLFKAKNYTPLQPEVTSKLMNNIQQKIKSYNSDKKQTEQIETSKESLWRPSTSHELQTSYLTNMKAVSEIFVPQVTVKNVWDEESDMIDPLVIEQLMEEEIDPLTIQQLMEEDSEAGQSVKWLSRSASETDKQNKAQHANAHSERQGEHEHDDEN